jgi:hypothetical protein
MGLPVLALVAAVAVVFECLPLLRSGIGSVVYVFIWGFVLIQGTGTAFESIGEVTPSNDMIGFTRTMVDVRERMLTLGYDPSEGDTDLYQPTGGRETTRFTWNGINWTIEILLERLFWVAIAAVLALVAVVPFDRFDPARSQAYLRKKRKRSKKKDKGAIAHQIAAEEMTGAEDFAEHLQLSSPGEENRRLRLWSTLTMELRLMVRGQPWWWYCVVLGLLITCLVIPYKYFFKFIVPLVWLWPIFLWSNMGTQEHRHRTNQMVFSCAHLIVRQLPAVWLSGVLVAAAVTGGAAVRFLATGEMYALFCCFVGIVFVPALALALGVWTNSGRLFEMIYFLIWLLGVYSGGRFWPLDFLGRGGKSAAIGVPWYYLVFTLFLLVIAVTGRRKQITASLR